MPSPPKKKQMPSDPLCCLVNKRGDCHVCKRPACDDHGFDCIGCGEVCVNCVIKKECNRCSSDVCHKCLMDSAMESGICIYCYEVEQEDQHLNYDQDWLDDKEDKPKT